jgi:hypothetical protein
MYTGKLFENIGRLEFNERVLRALERTKLKGD